MKILIIEAIQVVFNPDIGGEHVSPGEIIDVPKDQAGKLTQANRALYVNKADDSYKDGRFTAPADMLKAAEAMAKAKAKGKKAAEPIIPPAGETGDENPDA